MKEEQTINELPKGWKWVSFIEVAEVNPKIPNREHIPDDLEIQFLPMKLVEELTGKIHLTETRLYGEVKKGYTPFIHQDVLFAKVTPCMENGKIAIVENLKNGIGFGSSEFHVVRSKKDLLNKFAFYFLIQQKFRSDAENAMTGAVGLRRVPKQFIENYRIPFPPPNEQQQIVSKIEELFSELDKGIEELKTAQQQLKVYRQAVLKWAFEGKLTNTENEIKVIALGDIVRVVSGNTPKGLDSCKNSGTYQFYKVSDMNLVGNEIEMRTTKLSLTEHEIENLKVKTYPKGTVIFPKRGGAILTNKKRILAFDSSFDLNIMGALPNERVSSKYLFYWFQKLDLSKIYDGSNVPQINNKNIEPLRFELSSIEDQQQIVQEIESRLSVCDKIEETIIASLKQAEALRQSILKKAFEGNLS